MFLSLTGFSRKGKLRQFTDLPLLRSSWGEGFKDIRFGPASPCIVVGGGFFMIPRRQNCFTILGMQNLSQIQSETVHRVTTTWDELDYVYGPADDPGAPEGRISIWSGSPGVGKSRTIAEMMKRLSKFGLKSVLFQGEVPASNFKEEKFAGVDSPHIYLSEADTLDEICKGIVDVAPAWAFIDSIQMLRCVRSAAKAVGKKPVEYTIERLRESILASGTHLVLISQLNKEGKTKGSNDLPHLVDIECHISPKFPEISKSLFKFEIPTKNRYGPTGREAVFGHRSWGVECQSDHRLDDEEWMGHNPGGKAFILPKEMPGADLIEKMGSVPMDVGKDFESKPVKAKDTRPWLHRVLDIQH